MGLTAHARQDAKNHGPHGPRSPGLKPHLSLPHLDRGGRKLAREHRAEKAERHGVRCLLRWQASDAMEPAAPARADPCWRCGLLILFLAGGQRTPWRSDLFVTLSNSRIQRLANDTGEGLRREGFLQAIRALGNAVAAVAAVDVARHEQDFHF